ncbi:DUF2079 domain-containing protein [Oscillatoria salina]|uniref:DUF2079 domain-containing protein n=1 Tax=Oscillatoria salina TaxID=331517 RepID=UPI0013BA6AFC|nr:DUF2079 domain-containing protein [Oscillatoria salina]MBZ8181203.1 DUF2079 domain-containing protein [Oscillatoria salina IIICB1]NET88656.1 DUF2079 domain-containing protein [Kamptonema sp. SIO1D9]
MKWQKQPATKAVILVAIAFFLLTLTISLHRYYSLYSNTDHGIFNQVFWNSSHGKLFQSSLSSSLSTNVQHNDELPTVYYQRLGQHFTPALLLFVPIYALFPSPATLNVLQVILLTAAGLVLYLFAREYLQPNLAAMVTISYYAANAVMGPSLGNFFDLCQIPLYVFSLLLAKEKRWWWLFWLLIIFSLAVREDTGVILFSIGVYWVLSKRSVQLGLAVCTVSLVYMIIVTNFVMPLFSEDIFKRFTIERFGQFAEGEEASTLEIFWGMISNPWRLMVEFVTPWGRKIQYLLGHWLPVAFIPAISPATWTLTAFPLTQLFLQQGDSPLSINIRYAVAVVPGVFYGTIIWWSQHQEKFQPRIRRFWAFCLVLSLFFTLTSNPHRALFFLVPDSIDPWIYKPLTVQWQHVDKVSSLLEKIEPDASISVTRFILPKLSSRRVILRFPDFQYRDDNQEVGAVDYVLVDLWQVEYEAIFESRREELKDRIDEIEKLRADEDYALIGFTEGVVLLQKSVTPKLEAETRWQSYQEKIAKILSEFGETGD